MNSDPPNDVQFDKTFFDNLKQFVTELKTKPVTPEVGLYVNATSMMYYSNNPNVPGWFNFADWMNDLMDYYIIGFDKFNPCNDQFKSGIVPLNDSNVQTNNTLTAFANVLKSSNIAKDKIYLEFSVSPITDPEISDNIPKCYVSYKKYCDPDNTQKYDLYWCADNADSFFQKGKFASDIKAKGIVAKNIDLSDPTGNCGCDNQNQFITFSMILRGFLNQAPITDCEKLKNTAI
ncbi:uncharacterized protein LOC112601007 [Melanaphis sacchari]|uniref:uncharacterized protein LOC112601007 n=1 Tax=Melanaphis sacchari TaxID=742174 RepID=UPI000DC14E70|nr:uncharacterized protein LOC112601007 [Melanaphis sacchari]